MITALMADSGKKLQSLVTEFGRVCNKRKVKANVGKSKVTPPCFASRIHSPLGEEVLQHLRRQSHFVYPAGDLNPGPQV